VSTDYLKFECTNFFFLADCVFVYFLDDTLGMIVTKYYFFFLTKQIKKKILVLNLKENFCNGLI
jgi:hypothetical protein